MRFYKLEGTIEKSDWAEGTQTHKELSEKAGLINLISCEFNEKYKDRIMMCVSSIKKNLATLTVVSQTDEDIEKRIKEFLKKVDLVLSEATLEEITFSVLRKLLQMAERNDFIDDDDETLEQLGLNALTKQWNNSVEFSDNLIEEKSKELLYDQAASFLASDSVTRELDRIYAGHQGKKLKGHPVHYLVCTDDRDTRREMYQTLLSALYANGRIQNSRYVFLDIRPGRTAFGKVFDAIYTSCKGGCVVIRIETGNKTDDDEADENIWAMVHVGRYIRKYAKDVLTVVCLPQECSEEKEELYKRLKEVSFVEIEEELAYGKRAEEYLKLLAKDLGVRANKRLFNLIEGDRGYLTIELKELFDGWFTSRLKSDCYPQYKDIRTARNQLAAGKPKGSAYSELMEMIGLDSAKKIINQAIDYSKAQKIFADKGMSYETLSRHMVFTGNPGTAKTTVARLFARIMKENGILSRGHLVETGRADLVGKYVGWTAKIIKEKFEEAEGGVLFIDEAYSLVDDRHGSFGDEAINTIVQEMENHRKDTVVIFAGYPEEMEKFLAQNPGLSSRIAFHVSFEDYNTEELCQIAKLIAKQKNLLISEDACSKLETIFEIARNQRDFGNGRYARNVIEHAKMAQASRLVSMDYEDVTKSDVETLCADDFEMPKEIKTEKKVTMGFCA